MEKFKIFFSYPIFPAHLQGLVSVFCHRKRGEYEYETDTPLVKHRICLKTVQSQAELNL